ncbi:MAG: BF3164 family lipoprotein [Bacteroidales bacterium]
MNKNYLIFIIFVICSCINNEKKSFDAFPFKTNLSPIKSIRFENLFDPIEFKIVDSLIFFNDKKDEDCFLKIYNLNSSIQISGFGVIGRGPNEFISPELLVIDKKNNYIWIADYPSQIVRKYNLKQMFSGLKKDNSILQFEIRPIPLTTSFQIIKNNNILVSTLNGNGLFDLYDSIGIFKKNIGVGSYESSINLNEALQSIYFRKITCYDSVNNTIYGGYIQHDIIFKMNLSTEETIMKKSRNFKETKPEFVGNENIKQDFFAFTDITIYKNLIYAAHLGSTGIDYDNFTVNYPRDILVFNKNLDPIAVLKFHKEIYGFEISEEGLIYILSKDPDTEIYVCNLPKLPN